MELIEAWMDLGVIRLYPQLILGKLKVYSDVRVPLKQCTRFRTDGVEMDFFSLAAKYGQVRLL